MSRTVLIASPSANQAKRVVTEATTWGELQGNPEVASLLTSGVEAVVKPGNTTLRGNDSALPEGDFKLFLIPTKNKAGYRTAFDVDDVKEQVNDLVDEAFDKYGASIIAIIKTALNGGSTDQNSATGQDNELVEALAEAKQMI